MAEIERSNAKLNTNLYTMLKESDSNMTKKIKNVVDRVADKVRCYSQFTSLYFKSTTITISTVTGDVVRNNSDKDQTD